MSHQTGIAASSELSDLFNRARNGCIRVIKVVIVGETLEQANSIECSSTFEDDYKNQVPSLLDENNGCYVLVRTDEKNHDGVCSWILLQYSPDSSPVREKMLYAATKSTFKTIFGHELISDEVYGTTPSDVDYSGYLRHVTARDAPPPLTEAEQEYLEIKAQEKHVAIDQRAETLPGVSFPVDPNILSEIEKMRSGETNYVEIFVDSTNEKLSLKDCGTISLGELKNKKFSEPRYHIFNYIHEYNGEDIASLVFVYSMPGYSCPVRDRMLYSSCKTPLLTYLQGKEIKFDVKFELEELDQLSDQFLLEEIHPQVVPEKVAFAKPKRPGKR